MKTIAPLLLLALVGCDDGGGESDVEAGPVDAAVIEPDAAASGCARDIDCLAAEYCDREAPAADSDAEPPLGSCVPGCRLQPDPCPVGRMCNPTTRECVGECTCEPGEVNGCTEGALNVCGADCFTFQPRPCAGGETCRDGECRDWPGPEPEPEPAPEPEPEPDPDMAPPAPDMAPPEPDMAPPEPDMAPPEPQPQPDMALPAPDMAP